jgi:hypothetical protein
MQTVHTDCVAFSEIDKSQSYQPVMRSKLIGIIESYMYLDNMSLSDSPFMIQVHCSEHRIISMFLFLKSLRYKATHIELYPFHRE